MINSGQQDIIVQFLLENHPDIIAIYVFGSTSKGTTNSESDIDIALLPKKPLVSWERWILSQRLAKLLNQEVDLVDLSMASTVLRMQIISSGKCLYEGNRKEKERFEDYVYSSYTRFNEERKAIIKDVQDRGKVYG